MAASNEFVAFVSEQLAPLGGVVTKRFFGGRGLYCDGVIFAFVIQDVLYFKVDDTTRPTFEAEGSAPFAYDTKKGSQTVNGYWQAPERLFDDQEALLAFARQAIAVSRRAKVKTKPRAKLRSAKPVATKSNARSATAPSTAGRRQGGGRKK